MQDSNIVGAAIANAAKAYRGSQPADFTANAQAFLTALGFAPDFVNNVMPWAQISAPGINAVTQIIEPDDLDYDDGGCFGAFTAALTAVNNIK